MNSINLDHAKIFVHRLLTNKVTLGGILVIALIYLWFNPTNSMEEGYRLKRISLILFWTCVYYIILYLYLPKTLVWVTSRRLSPLWAIWSLLSCVALFELFVFYRTGIIVSWSQAFNFLAINLLILSVGTCGLVLILRRNIELELGIDPIRSIFSKAAHLDALQVQLPKNIRGRIIGLNAQNPYVEVVTDNGSHMIRSSMKDVIEFMNEKDGLLVHKSRWLAKSEIVGLCYRDGNPVVIDSFDKEIPISRHMVREIRKAISQNEHA